MKLSHKYLTMNVRYVELHELDCYTRESLSTTDIHREGCEQNE